MQNYPQIEPEAYGRWWHIVKKEYTNSNQHPENIASHNQKNKENAVPQPHSRANEPHANEDSITKKLKEIRNRVRPASPKVNLKDSIEKSVKNLVSKGLTIIEAIEYEANQNRIKQLQEKMAIDMNTTRNQYKGTKQQHHINITLMS